jgi:hypothetical protein
LMSGFLMVGMVGSFVSGMGAAFALPPHGRLGAPGTPTPTGFDGYKCIRNDKHLQAPGYSPVPTVGELGIHRGPVPAR